jgi:hypothetical protein
VGVPRLCAAALCASLLAPALAEAQAREVWKSRDGGSSFDVGAFYKVLGTAVRNQSGLVEGTEALQRLFDQVRVAWPALEVADTGTIPDSGASLANTARVWGRLLWKNRVELSAGWQVDATVASDAALKGGAWLGSPVSIADRQAAGNRRLVDFDHALADRGTCLLQHNLDLLAVKVVLPLGEIVVGRQVLSWGTGRFWNPTDLLSPFAPTDVDREVRHGVDAVRFSLPLSKTSLVDLLYLPQKHGWAQGGVARVQANARGFDVSVSAAKYVSDVVFGADTAGDIGPLGVHGELAYTLGLANLGGPGRVEIDERFVRGVAGLDWRPAERWTLGAEYYFNGFGAADPAGYVGKLRSDRAARGEVFGAGRHYLGLSAAHQATPLLSLQALLLANLADPSALAIPVAEYWAAQKVLVRIGGYVPIGSHPNAAMLRGLTAPDVINHSAAFVSASSSLGLRSEYGSSPWGLFAQAGIYF